MLLPTSQTLTYIWLSNDDRDQLLNFNQQHFKIAVIKENKDQRSQYTSSEINKWSSSSFYVCVCVTISLFSFLSDIFMHILLKRDLIFNEWINGIDLSKNALFISRPRSTLAVWPVACCASKPSSIPLILPQFKHRGMDEKFTCWSPRRTHYQNCHTW